MKDDLGDTPHESAVRKTTQEVVKKLYYCEDGGEFYWIKQTPKTIIIEWVEKKQSDGTHLDQNVNSGVVSGGNPYKREMRVKKDNSGQHCLKENNEERILIYPFRNGQPFYLEPATLQHITNEIVDCKKWGVSDEYYRKLLPFL